MKNIFSRIFALAPIVAIVMVLGIAKPATAAVVTFNRLISYWKRLVLTWGKFPLTYASTWELFIRISAGRD